MLAVIAWHHGWPIARRILGLARSGVDAALDAKFAALHALISEAAEQRSAAFRELSTQRDAAVLAAVEAVEARDRERDEQLNERLERWEDEMARTLTGVLEQVKAVAEVVGELKSDRDHAKAERERDRVEREAEERAIARLAAEGRLRPAV